MVLDIHRPENFKDPKRLQSIFDWAHYLSNEFKIPCVSLRFPQTYSYINREKINTYSIDHIDLMSYKEYLRSVYDSMFIVSDSGTAQEEPAILRTPVLVPREYTERPQSYDSKCSKYLPLQDLQKNKEDICSFILRAPKNMDSGWLGSGETSNNIVKHIKGMYIK